MANQELTIQFEGYDDNTETYVVLTNGNDEIEEILSDDPLIETEQIEIQPIYEDDIDHLMLNDVRTTSIDPNPNDEPTASGSRRSGATSRKRKYDDTEVSEWTIKLPVGIVEGIREPLRPYRVKKAVKGDTETTKDGVKRRHDGKRWHRLCCVKGCDRVCKKMGKCITHFNNTEDRSMVAYDPVYVKDEKS